MSINLSRRTFLGGVLTVAATTVLGLRWWRERRDARNHVTALLELLEHRDSAVVLGRRYREAVPSEAGKEPLIVALADTFGQAIDLPAGAPAMLRRIVDEQIHRDFNSGRVVEVDGWLLSMTEARLCALASLEPYS